MPPTSSTCRSFPAIPRVFPINRSLKAPATHLLQPSTPKSPTQKPGSRCHQQLPGFPFIHDRSGPPRRSSLRGEPPAIIPAVWGHSVRANRHSVCPTIVRPTIFHSVEGNDHSVKHGHERVIALPPHSPVLAEKCRDAACLNTWLQIGRAGSSCLAIACSMRAGEGSAAEFRWCVAAFEQCPPRRFLRNALSPRFQVP